MSAKPVLAINGETNRTTLIPTDFEVFVDGDPVELDIIVNPSLTGANYNVSASDQSGFIVDTSATSYIGGSTKDEIFCGSGITHRELVEDLQNTLKLSADGTSQPIFTLAAKCLKTGGNADVKVLFRWKESF